MINLLRRFGCKSTAPAKCGVVGYGAVNTLSVNKTRKITGCLSEGRPGLSRGCSPAPPCEPLLPVKSCPRDSLYDEVKIQYYCDATVTKILLSLQTKNLSAMYCDQSHIVVLTSEL